MFYEDFCQFINPVAKGKSTDNKNLQHPNDVSLFLQTLSESEDSPYSPDASWLQSKFSRGIGTSVAVFLKWYQ